VRVMTNTTQNTVHAIIQDTVRVRFAPSPTGHLHIGGLRSALFNWLFARHHNGKFLLRLEDTDVERSKPEYTASILEAFSWLGITSDEPIVIQSERCERHLALANYLIETGAAYRCYCTPQELQERLGANSADGEGYTRYDGACRTLALQQETKTYAIRFKIPDCQDVEFNDLIRGPIVFKRDQLDDFIIVRSDGSPMYNFVVVVDDADMAITHVIRGEEHIGNTPKQILLYRALSFTEPQFAHLPVILGPDGSKLSKRHGATSVVEYKKMGFLAQALVNYLVRLGWSHGDQEIFSLDEMIQYFSLDHVGKKGAIFDATKLEWVNSVYIRQTSTQDLIKILLTDVEPMLLENAFGQRSYTPDDHATFEKLIELYKERVKTVKELAHVLQDLIVGPSYESYAALVGTSSELIKALKVLVEKLSAGDYTRQNIETAVKTTVKEFGLSLSAFAPLLRVLLTGQTSSPSVYDLMVALGVERVLPRLERGYVFLADK